MDLDSLRTCAILHDIGKPAAWTRGRPWSEHIFYSHEIIAEVLGKDYASTAMRHHTGAAYLEKYHPQSMDEKIIWLADKLSSGADRREMPEEGTAKPRPPFILTHPLSRGDKPVFQLDAGELKLCSDRIIESLHKAAQGFSENSQEGYLKIYRALENSDLQSIPADTRSPINDVSLWHHSKLTAAFTTCISLESKWRGENPSDYEFTLLSGDGDRISQYIMESKRIPDLNARSERVKQATAEAGKLVEDLVGPECLLFAGGGSLLALCPNITAEKVSEGVSDAFEEAMEGEATFTASLVRDTGDKIQYLFGEVWRKAGQELRIKKLEKPKKFYESLEADVPICDVCRRRTATHVDAQKILPINASPRPEALCDHCWKLREAGGGIWIENLVQKTNYIAVIKADGDDVGKVLDGTRFKEIDKEVSPSRLSTISSLLNDICEDELKPIVESYGGGVIFAGGDDVLALLPGERAMDAAIALSNSFRKVTNHKCTMSTGIAITHKNLPIYVGLERAHELIRVAKKRTGKNGVAYTIMGGLGRGGEVSDMAIGWDELDKALEIIDFFKLSRLPNSQIRRIARASQDPGESEVLIKYLMGKKRIPWEKGEELLGMLESGLLGDAFRLYNLFKVD